MDKFKDYEKLVGYSYVTGQEKVIPNTLEDVADYIVREGLKGDVMIIATDNTPVLNTMGFFVDRCSDPEYMEALRPILIENRITGTSTSTRIQKLSQMKMRTTSRKCDYIRCDTVSHFDFPPFSKTHKKRKAGL